MKLFVGVILIIAADFLFTVLFPRWFESRDWADALAFSAAINIVFAIVALIIWGLTWAFGS